MKKHLKLWLGLLLGIVLCVVAWWFFGKYPVPVLQPSGEIGEKQRNLIVATVLMSVIVVVPVFILLGVFSLRYRESGGKGKYDPTLAGSAKAETVWWLIPAILIGIISVITWRSSYALDPFKQLSSNQPTLHVQVVALDWKWLFIYPKEHIASVNEVTIPVGRPVEFDITSDTVMTSFWAPSLGGQMYAMPGMNTKLNLNATKLGTYDGSAANISGTHFADMRFKVYAFDTRTYNDWLHARQTMPSPKLTAAAYNTIAKPGVASDLEFTRFGSIDPSLYDTIIMKYMMPMGSANNTHTTTTPEVKE